MKIEINLITGFSENYKNLIPIQGDLKEYECKKGRIALKNSIVSEGIIFPTFIWNDGDKKYIWDGHGRQEVYKLLEAEGYEIPDLPVVYILAKNRADAKIKLLKKEQDYRRRISKEGLGDFLDNESITIDDIEGINLPGIGEMDISFLNGIMNSNEKDNTNNSSNDTNAGEVPKVPKAKIGDIYQLDNHRIMCGDSLIKENVEALMDGLKAYALYTDPPYGMNLECDYSYAKNKLSCVSSSGGNKYSNVIGDNKPFNAQWILPLFEECEEIFLWGADYYIETICRTYESLGSWVVWDKRSNEGTGIEQAISSDKMFGSSFELCWSKNKHKRLIARIRNGIFGVNNESGTSKRFHPTEKPIQLHKWFFDKWIPEGSLVADLFLGSGSTLIACEDTNRKCYGMELEPGYIDVTIDRWERHTGKKAKKIN